MIAIRKANFSQSRYISIPHYRSYTSKYCDFQSKLYLGLFQRCNLVIYGSTVNVLEPGAVNNVLVLIRMMLPICCQLNTSGCKVN